MQNFCFNRDDVIREDNTIQPTATSASVSVNISCIGNETSIDQCQTEIKQQPDVHDQLVNLTCKGQSTVLLSTTWV